VKNPLISTTRELLDLALLGSRTPKRNCQDAADSIRSLLALNLKCHTVIVPPEMVGHYRVLAREQKKSTK
jgi:hypothetical protein